MNYLRKIWRLILDMFFPPICLYCRGYLTNDEKVNLLCEKCFVGINIYTHPFRIRPDFILAAAGSYDNGALRTLIHYFKYERFLAAEKPLGEIITKHLKLIEIKPHNALIIPVPLHKKRFRARGFNQSEIIAKSVSIYFGLELKTDILKRTKDAKSQMKIKDHDERRKNIKKNFEITQDAQASLIGKIVLLVDDVYTSGATMNEAACTLRRAGVAKVIGVVLAKAG